MVCKKDTRVYTISGECPYVQFGRVLELVCSRGYKTVERGNGLPSLWWRGVMRVRECLRVRSLYGDPPFPFYKLRAKVGYMSE
jgi:hypothetical protein